MTTETKIETKRGRKPKDVPQGELNHEWPPEAIAELAELWRLIQVHAAKRKDRMDMLKAIGNDIATLGRWDKQDKAAIEHRAQYAQVQHEAERHKAAIDWAESRRHEVCGLCAQGDVMDFAFNAKPVPPGEGGDVG
jgi:hypothetical protein